MGDTDGTEPTKLLGAATPPISANTTAPSKAGKATPTAKPRTAPVVAASGAPSAGKGASTATLAPDPEPEVTAQAEPTATSSDAISQPERGVVDPEQAASTEHFPGAAGSGSPTYASGRRWYQLAVVTIFVLAGLWRLVAMLQWNWIQDDWAYVIGAHDTPFWPYVTEGYTGHLMPGQFAFIWIITRLAPLNYGWAIAGVWSLGMASLVVWAILFRRILGRRWAAVVPLVPFALAAGWLPIVLWVAAALQALSLQLFLGLTLLASLRWIERGKLSGLVLTFAAFVGGLLFWEKALLIPIAVVGLGLLLARDAGGRLRRMRLVALVLTLAVPAVAYAVVYRAVVPGDGESRVGITRSFVDSVAFYWSATVAHLLPSSLGGPWHEPMTPTNGAAAPSTWAQWMVIGLAIVVILWGLTRRRRGWIPVATAAVYGAASLGLVLTSTRFDYLGRVVVLDSRYEADTLAVLLLMGTLLLVPAASERGVLREGPPDGRALRLRPWVMPVGAAVLVASCLYSNSVIWDSLAIYSPRPWVNAVTADAQRVGNASVYDTHAPPNVITAILFPDDSRLSRMLSPLELPIRWNEPTQRMLTVDATGHLVVAAFGTSVQALPGPVPRCGYLLQPGRPVTVALTAPAFAWEWGLVVGGYSRVGGTIIVRADHRQVRMPFGTGLTSTQAILTDSAKSLTLTAAPGSGPICVTTVTLGIVSPTTHRA